MIRLGKNINSTILTVGGSLWKFDAYISAGVFISFFIAYYLDINHYAKFSPYVDPIMSIIMVLALIKPPLQAIWHNILDLVDANPDGDIEEILAILISQQSLQYAVANTNTIKIRRAGRQLFINVQYNITEQTQTIKELQQLNQELRHKIQKIYPNSNVDITMI